MTRALGDERVKENISSEPDVASLVMDTDVKFKILASDGLRKVRVFRFQLYKYKNKLILLRASY